MSSDNNDGLSKNNNGQRHNIKTGRTRGFAPTGIQRMVQWFKTMTVNEYIRGVKSKKYPPFDKSIWQRNYYEHVVRDERDLGKVREYITKNPINWIDDENYIE